MTARFPLRYNNWKRCSRYNARMDWTCGRSRTSPLRLSMLFNQRMNPFERAEQWEDYPRWRVDNAWAFMPAQAIVAQFFQSFKEFRARKTRKLQPRSNIVPT